MGFHELIQQGREPGENGLPENYFDSLSAEFDQTAQAHEARMRELAEGFTAKESSYQAEIQARDSELQRLKMQNYDLLMSSPSDGTGNQQQGDEDNGPQGVDSLFE
jgi:hypothetical protein